MLAYMITYTIYGKNLKIHTLILVTFVNNFDCEGVIDNEGYYFSWWLRNPALSNDKSDFQAITPRL